jgi:uncharacterized protein YndB with AHSA1/START domain
MATTYNFDRGFTVKRTFDAPPDLVFQAWTDPDYLGWFFNPGIQHDVPVSVDLRVGGQWRQQMVESADKQYITGGVYREIARPGKLVFSWGAVGGWPAIDLDRLDEGPLVTILLNPAGQGTEMELKVQFADHLTEEAVRRWITSGMQEGWSITVDRLADQLAARTDA